MPRKPKSKMWRLLNGNPGRRPRKDEPAPVCPSWLSDEAKAEWRRLVRRLDAIGMLEKADPAAMAAYCVAWVQMTIADADVVRRGPVLSTPNGLVRNPFVGVFRDSAVVVRFCARLLGLLP